MATIKKGDFIELEYTGMLKSNKTIFDTTSEATAKKAEIHGNKAEYGPIVICVGQHHVIPGIDEQLEGKEVGKEYTVDVLPEKAFGKKDARLVHMIPESKFTKEGIRPMPGLQVNIDGTLGLVKRTGGGRVLVDFNHPLAGQEVVYTVTPTKLVTDDGVKLKSLLQLQFRTKDWDVSVADGKATIANKKLKLPAELAEPLSKHIHELIPSIKEVMITQAP